MNMFCYQCEQSAKGSGCTVAGVCGKDPETAALQDLLVHACQGISRYAHRARQAGQRDETVDRFILKGLFTTVTNVNFDKDRLAALLEEAAGVRKLARQLCERAGVAVSSLNGPTQWQPATTVPGLVAQGRGVAIPQRIAAQGEDLTALQELLLYGLKGTAAYAEHALTLGRESDTVYAFLHEALDFLAEPAPAMDQLLGFCLRCGEVNLEVMALLDAAHTDTYGHPVPTSVRTTPRRGKAILVSGHDLKDLEELLRQTMGTGIQVYTHGEMLPAHGYPALKQYPHLVGNYGGAWQDQQEEFAAFPGAVLMTTNCIQKPLENYRARLFTSGLVAWPGVTHIANRDFSPVIAAALAAPGFTADGPEHSLTVGFGHHAVLGVADTVIDAVKSGAIRHFFLIGGCDGAKPGRNYYTELAEKVPDDCVILTLACGKYRFNQRDYGTIGGLPRLLDMGQCNDAYSAIRVAGALAQAFDTDVNRLPLSLVLSWYEQKAVCILLTLLHLGIRNIRLGPSLPAFVTPAVLQVLVDQFGIQPITTAEQDLDTILAGAV